MIYNLDEICKFLFSFAKSFVSFTKLNLEIISVSYSGKNSLSTVLRLILLVLKEKGLKYLNMFSKLTYSRISYTWKIFMYNMVSIDAGNLEDLTSSSFCFTYKLF